MSPKEKFNKDLTESCHAVSGRTQCMGIPSLLSVPIRTQGIKSSHIFDEYGINNAWKYVPPGIKYKSRNRPGRARMRSGGRGLRSLSERYTIGGKMGKIISVTENLIVIKMDDGTVEDAEISSLSFSPYLGQRVEVTGSGGEIKVEPVEETLAGNTFAGASASQEGKAVNKLAYALLAIFLGGLGVHKFYAGKTGQGILYLVFCWTCIPGIIGFIEGIIALTKPEDKNGNIIL